MMDLMKRMIGLFGWVASVNVIALVGLIVFLFAGGKLNGQRVATILKVIRGEELVAAVLTSQPTSQPAESGSAQQRIARDAAQEELVRRQNERAIKEIADREALLQTLLLNVMSREEELNGRELALAVERKKLTDKKMDRGFKKNLEYLENVKADNAKALLRSWKEPDVVRFFLEMDPDVGKKIIDKCTSPDDRQWIGRILTRIRDRDVLRAEALEGSAKKTER